MQAIALDAPGGPEMLRWGTAPDPVAGPGEVLVDVAAAGVNRADIMQRQGHYPPPPGASEIIGLEVSGHVAALGEGVTGWQVGDPVCALLAGGGYAERVAVPAVQLLSVPDGVDLVTAAGIPEVACTVWSNVVMTARLAAGETFLVHGGSGGIGTHAIQVGKALGARVAATAAPERLDVCRALGADVVIDYHDDLPKGLADVILDNQGARGLAANVDALTPDGRLVIIGLQGGTKAELNIAKLLAKRGSVIATSLRGRPVEGKGAIVAAVREHVWPMIADGRVRPVVHTTLPLSDAADAHALFDEGGVVGKVILTAYGEANGEGE